MGDWQGKRLRRPPRRDQCKSGDLTAASVGRGDMAPPRRALIDGCIEGSKRRRSRKAGSQYVRRNGLETQDWLPCAPYTGALVDC